MKTIMNSIIVIAIFICILFGYTVNHIDVKCDNLESSIDKVNKNLGEIGQKIDSLNEKLEYKQKVNKDVVTHPYDDKRYKFSIARSGDRSKRYGVVKDSHGIKYKYFVWSNGNRMSIKQMRIITEAVFKRLPHIKTTEESVSLIVETIIAESNGGYYIDEGTGDLGCLQIRETTAEDLLQWLTKSGNKDIVDAINIFYNNEMSLKDNLKHNIPFSIAVAITEYWRKGGANFDNKIGTTQDRGVMWKCTYNTYKGEGTVNKFVQRVNSYKKYK